MKNKKLRKNNFWDVHVEVFCEWFKKVKTAGFIFSFRLPSTHSTLNIAYIFSIFLYRCLRLSLKRNPLKSDCDRRISSGMLVVTKFWHFVAFRDDYSHVIISYLITNLHHTRALILAQFCSHCPRLWLVITFMLFITYDRRIRVVLLHFTTNFAKKFRWRPATTFS